MNLTDRCDTEVRLPRFEYEDDDDDEVETVRMPNAPRPQPSPPSNASDSLNSQVSRFVAGLEDRVYELMPKLRQYAADLAQWYSYVRAKSRRYRIHRAPWIAAAAATLSLATAAILGAPPRSASREPRRTPDVAVTPVTNSAPEARDQILQPAALSIVPVDSLPLVKPGAAAHRVAVTHPPQAFVPARSTSTARLLPAQGGKRPFDVKSANSALDLAAASTRRCTRNQMAGTVTVSFDPSGVVNHVSLGTLAGDIVQTSCVMRAFQDVRIAPFAGRAVHVRKTFAVSR